MSAREKNGFRLIDNLCASFRICLVWITGARTGVFFHQH